MNEIALSSAAAILLVSLTWAATRWWYGRHIQRLQRALKRAEGAQHSAARMMGQARRQVEELQRGLAELRRRQFALDAVAEPTEPAPPATAAAPGIDDDGGPPVRKGGWADTLPM